MGTDRETVADRPVGRNTIANLTIETLAQQNLELAERIESLEADIASYRELGQAALHQLHAVTLERDRLRVQRDRLLDEFRRLRAEAAAA